MAETLAPETLSKIVSAFSEHVNVGAFVLPADVTPSRLGPEPPDSFPLLRDRLENAMYAMHGIPPALVAAQGTGTAMREAFRQVLHMGWCSNRLVRDYWPRNSKREVRPRRRPRLLTSFAPGDIVGHQPAP